MQNIFIDVLPPWVETGLQPAFYDLESGTVLQQTARMYAKVNEIATGYTTFTTNVTNEINQFEQDTNDEIERFENATNDEIERFENATNDEIERFENATNDEIERFEGVVNDTVEEYIGKFNDLHDYVEDYFDNLDVQQEINNKLDDMVEQGTLQEIITTYIQSNVAWTFDTVAEMQSATNLIVGSYAETMGYHSLDDNGGGLYLITDQVEATKHQEGLGGGLYATLVVNNYANIKQFGAYGDNSHDDTTVIQEAIDKYSNVFIPDGIFLVSTIVLHTNNTIAGNSPETSIIKSKDNNTETAIITTDDTLLANHITIKNITVYGNRENNSGIIDGICLEHSQDSDAVNKINDVRVYSCTGCGIKLKTQREDRIDRCIVSSCTGDGIYLDNHTTDCEVSNSSTFNHNGHGVVILAGTNRFENIKAYYCGKVSDDTAYADKLSGWYCTASKNTFVNCQAQECFGHGFEFINSEDISCIGIFVDNNGMYMDSDGNVQPLPVGQTPIYNGINLNHVRRSYFEASGANFHETFDIPSGTQAYTIYSVDATSTDKNTYIVHNIQQKIGSIYYSDTESTVIDNGKLIPPVEVVDVSSLLENSFVSDSNYPLTMRRMGRIVVINGVVKKSDNSNIPTSEQKMFAIPFGYQPLERTIVNCVGMASSATDTAACEILSYALPTGSRNMYIHNKSGTDVKYARINATWISTQ